MIELREAAASIGRFANAGDLVVVQRADDHIVFDLPETHEKVTSQFLIERVDGPAPFDLKLTIFSDPRGPSERSAPHSMYNRVIAHEMQKARRLA